MRTADKDTGNIDCNIPRIAACIMEQNLWTYERYRKFRYLAAIRKPTPSFISCLHIEK
jgi:hypothetical protein